MGSQEIRNLQEAYMEVYQELDEEITPARRRQYKAGLKVRQANQETAPGKARPKKRPTPPTQHPSMRTGLTQSMRDKIRDDAREENPDRPEGPGGITKNPRKLAQQKARGQHAEQVDLYDIILSHLLDEGYAETPEAAKVIMVNMSEEWRDSIVEETLGEAYVPLRTSDEMYDDEGFPTRTRSWSKKYTNALMNVGREKARGRYGGTPNISKGVSAMRKLEKMKKIDAEPESKRAARSQAAAQKNKELGSKRRALQTSFDRQHLEKSFNK